MIFSKPLTLLTAHEFISQCLHQCFNLAYQFYSSLDGSLQPTDGETIQVDIDAYNSTGHTDKWPENGEPGTTKSTYTYQDSTVKLELSFNETWTTGELPYDSRYSMPEKIYISRSWNIEVNSNNRELSFSIFNDSIKKESSLSILKDTAEKYISKTFEASWGRTG